MPYREHFNTMLLKPFQCSDIARSFFIYKKPELGLPKCQNLRDFSTTMSQRM